MKIEEGKFYFLKDSFYEEIKDSNLANNKDNGSKRPCYYCRYISIWKSKWTIKSIFNSKYVSNNRKIYRRNVYKER